MLSPAERVAEVLKAAEHHQCECGGVQLAWQKWPARSVAIAPPLLLLHGGFGSWNHWIANLLDLRQDREVWTLDLPGLGRSGDMPEPHSIDHFAHIVLKGINQLIGHEQKLALAGFSFGAMITGRLAVLLDQRCTACTLIGAAGFGVLHAQVALLPLPLVDASAREAKRIHEENLQRLMLHKPSSIDDIAIHLHSENLRKFRFRSRLLAKSNELAELLPDISAPLVGIWGAEDATAGGQDQIEARRELFSQAQPSSQFHVIDGAGHWVMYEAPEAVNDILRL
ncbi:MAG: alpha/beta hydrolase [Pseudomonadota bacterium]